MTKVQLPAGCTGLDMANGKKYNAEKPGGQVEVTSSDSRFINTSWYGQAGVMAGSQSLSFGTRKGRWCDPCRRLWNSWTTVCHKCGQPTLTDEGRALTAAIRGMAALQPSGAPEDVPYRYVSLSPQVPSGPGSRWEPVSGITDDTVITEESA